MHDYKRMYYKTSDGSMTMDFVFMDCGELLGWRAYIINPINYKGRKDGGHDTHRNHYKGDTYKCICWSVRVKTLSEMKNIAALWSDVTALYIKKGGNFDDIAAKLMKKNRGGKYHAH